MNKMANIYADIDECIQSLMYYYDIQVDFEFSILLLCENLA